MSPRPPSTSPYPAGETASPPGSPWVRFVYDYGPVLLMMGIIFTASTDAGTSAHSGRIIEAVLSWFGARQRLTGPELDALNHYIRKAAHLTEYALLAMLLHRAAARGGPPAAGRGMWSGRVLLGIIGFVALYAASDEFHQRYVATRTPSAWDVMLDTVGGALGLVIQWGWERWRRPSCR